MPAGGSSFGSQLRRTSFGTALGNDGSMFEGMRVGENVDST